MIEAALVGLAKVFAWPALGYMFLGVIIGLVVGILPGIGGLFSLAVLIPFTFKMDPASAFALLLGAHAPSYTGGAITTILLNTPGDPPNAATLFDGYPMTKKGQAGRALGAAGPMAGPPGANPERMKVLEEALKKTLEDPGFIQVAKKQQMDIIYLPPGGLIRIIQKGIHLSPDLKGKLQEILRRYQPKK